jgi:hypothetical protein
MMIRCIKTSMDSKSFFCLPWIVWLPVIMNLPIVKQVKVAADITRSKHLQAILSNNICYENLLPIFKFSKSLSNYQQV